MKIPANNSSQFQEILKSVNILLIIIYIYLILWHMVYVYMHIYYFFPVNYNQLTIWADEECFHYEVWNEYSRSVIIS